jgi:hypothetical protein
MCKFGKIINLMKQELDKLVELSLADGYISDKEREVLRKKAEKLGYDADEIDVILDGKLYLNSNQNKSKVRKCVSCGEILGGMSKVCPACDYINTEDNSVSETVEDDFSELHEILTYLKFAKPNPGIVPGNVFKTLITFGLFIPYKLLIRKESLFDRYAKVTKTYSEGMDEEAAILRTKYGTNPELNANIDKLLAERDTIISSRRRDDFKKAAVNFALWGLIIWGIFAIANQPKAPETAEEKTERLIKEKKISAAKAAFAGVTDPFKKDEFEASITRMELDSLLEIKNYDEALKVANLLKNDGSYHILDRDEAINEIVEKQVLELLDKKEYKAAREKSKLAEYLKQSELEDKIELAEKLDKKKK